MSRGTRGDRDMGGGSVNRMENTVHRIPPYHYLHVLDHSTNVTRVEKGPKTYVTSDTEVVVLGPEKMVVVPPCHYCTVKNPVSRDDKGAILIDPLGQIKLRHADLEIRLEQEPFPLYPGEQLHQDVTPLQVVPCNSAFRLRANRDFMDGVLKRWAKDEWLFEGPGTYIPRKEVEVVETVRATVIKPNQALKLRASKETKDRDGNQRVAGEEWLVKKVGSYLPGAYEEIIDMVQAHVLTEKEAIHVRATRTFMDEFSKQRKNGEEWLITLEDTETYIPSVYIQVVGLVPIVTLSNRQYCVILDPVDPETGKPQLGQKKLIKGEKSFFLQPGEKLEAGIQDIYVLGETEGLILRAREAFTDNTLDPAVQRKPGDRWMICGPTEFTPLITTEVVTRRHAIPLDDTEGIYVRDIKTGKVRAICGKSYMLTQDEELWSKELPATVESLLQKNAQADRGTRSVVASNSGAGTRDKSRVVTYQVPHNGAVQLYDYKEKKSRVVFGPDLVMLQPDEQFTELSLSGGKPKAPNTIRTLCLLLGPDFCTDRVTVETADHARLMLQLAYNWHFDVGDKSAKVAARIFSVPDFVGDMCKAIASRVRGAVASVNFDHFHKNSARIIHEAVFGFDEQKHLRHFILFPQNNLNITSVDIQSVEPVDQRTRDALQKSVQLAIEITTSSQEATARHEAQRQEQEAKGRLARQKIEDEVKAERSRLELLELQSQSQTVEACGQSKAEALARAESSKIEGEAAVQEARLKADAITIKEENELALLTQARSAETSYQESQNQLEITKAKELAAIEAQKFMSMVNAIGQDTIKSIASAGLEHQVKLLQGLGLHSTLITDGKTPLNLFSTALGFLGRQDQHPTAPPRPPLGAGEMAAAP